ncbi:MAG: hypothetical protein VX438_04870, partial [Planctomycetota bacterium]|nr:hypothetical protein [Planctomycetota bacterium]
TVVSHSTPPRKHLAPVVQIVAEHAKGIISFGGKVIFLEPMEMIKVSGSDHLKTKFKTKPVSMTQKIDKLTQSAKKDFYDLSLENPVLEIALSKSRSTQSPYLRNFAVKSTVALGGFLPFVNFLRDEQNTPFWREAVRSFRQNLLSDAHLFDLGRKFFEESSSPDPQTAKQDLLFFQMLTTTTDQELASGRAELLVRSLENSNLAVRVAAIQSLYALTGKDQFFRADAPATKRQKGLKAWKKVLQTTGITVLTPFQLMQFE